MQIPNLIKISKFLQKPAGIIFEYRKNRNEGWDTGWNTGS
jgi:hypothetical protein